MAPKREKKGKTGSAETDDTEKPLPPNIFLYIQLAGIGKLPSTTNPLEIHMEQGGSVIVKCVEHYNTDGIILQDEFLAKPTYTLIFQQDNLDRINHAADNPLVIKLCMRKSEGLSIYGEEEEDLDEEQSAESMLNAILNKVDNSSSSQTKDDTDNFDDDKPELVLLCVGYLDLIKLFGHHRCMVREELFLYPVPNVSNELRTTVHSEWHLYTLVPIAKELTFTNLAFVSFESIYNLKKEYSIDASSFSVQLSFRSTTPISRNDYHVIPWCSFGGFTEETIANQNNYLMFESFRNSVSLSYSPGLKSTMEVQLHRLFSQIMRSDNLDVDFEAINLNYDLALVCNTFHRFILTLEMCNMLLDAFAWRRYVILVEAFQSAAVETKKNGKKGGDQPGKQKIFEGVLDPSVMLFPGVQTIRFAVELKYLGAKKKLVKTKRPTNEPPTSRKDSRISTLEPEGATFAIIRLCLLAPLGETYHELKVFRDSFISQNRLLHCNSQPLETSKITIIDMQRENYVRFDAFIHDTIRFIVDKKVRSVEEKRGNFCCVLQNLTNILLKVIGSDFNMRTHTTNNAEFANLCAVAFNELESRIHKILEKIEEEGLDELIKDRHYKVEALMDNMNTIKLMNAVGDKRMSNYFYEKEKTHGAADFYFYDLIAKMERGEYATAKRFFKTMNILAGHEYFSGWIHIFLNYVDTRDDPDPAISVNANECLLNSITEYSEKYGRQLDGWILLYCYYKRFNYSPGFTYARWRMEEQLGNKQQKINETEAPFSLWSLSLNINPEFKSNRDTVFFKCFKMFVRLGLFEFGQVIFNEVQQQCDEVDRYLINTQLKIFLNQLDEEFQPMEYGASEYRCEEEEMSPQDAFVAQLNGNVEYHRGNWEKAANYYERIVDQSTPEGETRDNYLLSKLRLAYISFDMEIYDQTVNALSQPFHGKLLNLVCNYLMGKAYYKLGELNKALECFITCTKFNTHLPDVWGFLALINLQLGNNLNAIHCWKYARVDPSKSITDETIFKELNLIDIDSVDLYIDVPESGSSLTSSVSSDDE
ncbi:hypothetical protein ACLKA6_015109 [Drosophila palustris]